VQTPRDEPSVEAADIPPKPRESWLRKHRLKLLTSVLIACGFGYLLHAGALPLVPSREALARIRWWTIPAFVVVWSVVHTVRAARWHWLLAPVCRVPLGRVIAVAFMGFAAILLLPFRAGEVVRPILIRKEGALSGWEAAGTVGAERVLDGLFLSGLLFVSLQVAQPLDPLPDRIGELPVPASVVPRAAYGALAMFAIAFTVMGAFFFFRRWARRATERIVGVVSLPLARWLANRVEQVADGLRFLPRARYTLPFLAATAVYWFLNGASMWLLAWGCGFDDMSFAQACATMGVLGLGILLPNAPGFFGAFQISIYAGLAMYFAPSLVVGPGAAYVFLIYVLQVFITFGAGALAMLRERTGLSEALAPGVEQFER
jgi:uncharacterized protein (TIRG00374 family)